MISFREVSKKFGKLEVLKSCTLSLEGNRVVALIGPNGSGKSTLMKCLLQLVYPDSGNVDFQQVNITASANYRSQLGYMPQISRYPEQMTVGALFGLLKDLRQDCIAYDLELYDAFLLHGLLGKKLASLSGGTKQKVSAAIAFMFNPQVLVLDEPSAGLDPVSTEVFYKKVKKERDNGKLVLITTHNLTEVDELADEIVFLYEGKLLFHKTVFSIREQSGEASMSKAIAHLTRDLNYD